MTDQTRSRDGGNIWMILLIALALIATVIMLFSSSAVWLQIALLAALWAAILGFMLVTRARNDRDAAEALLDARQREHDAELEALRARHDADRAAEGLPPSSASAADLEMLREIRAELAALRAQLEDLSGREFGYEPAALHAEARRIREIEARAGQASASSTVSAASASSEPEPRPTPAGQTESDKPASGSPWWSTSNSTEDTTRIAPVRDRDEDEAISALTGQTEQRSEPAVARQTGPGSSRLSGAPSSDAVAGRVGSHRATDGRNPLTDLIRERQEELEREKADQAKQQEQEKLQREQRERAARAEAERREKAEREQREQAARQRAEQERAERERAQREQAEREQAEREQAEREQAEQAQREQAEREKRAEEERRQAEARVSEARGRRRADEPGEGKLTVAELLARSQRGE